jgi:hypothetical protein
MRCGTARIPDGVQRHTRPAHNISSCKNTRQIRHLVGIDHDSTPTIDGQLAKIAFVRAWQRGKAQGGNYPISPDFKLGAGPNTK